MGAATRASASKAAETLANLQRPAADLGDELLSAARALNGSHQLVSVLADPGVPTQQRTALVQKAFAAAGPQTRSLLGELVASRWSTPDDLVAATEELGIRALAAPKSADGLERELFAVQQAVVSDGRVELALGSTASPVAARLALVDRLTADAKPATRSIVRHLVQLPRGRKPVEALRQAQTIVAGARDRLVAVVQVAAPLTEAQAGALAARLEAGYGRSITVNQIVDPDLLGGVRVTIGDDVIDGTIRARLDDLRLRLAG